MFKFQHQCLLWLLMAQVLSQKIQAIIFLPLVQLQTVMSNNEVHHIPPSDRISPDTEYSFNHLEIVRTLSQDCESFVTIPDPLSNPPEALRGGINTVDEILSPTYDLQDNGNGVMMVNPNQNPPYA